MLFPSFCDLIYDRDIAYVSLEAIVGLFLLGTDDITIHLSLARMASLEIGVEVPDFSEVS